MEDIQFFSADAPICFDAPCEPTRTSTTDQPAQPSTSGEAPLPDAPNFRPAAEAESARRETPILPTHLVCPYDTSHKMRAFEISAHLPSCRAEYMKKNSLKLEMKRCRYNGRHFVPSVELDFHEKSCNDDFYKRIYTEAAVEPRSWEIPERNDDQQKSLDMQDALVRFQAREYMIRMGARRLNDDDLSGESDDDEFLSAEEHQQPIIPELTNVDTVHSDDSAVEEEED